MNARGSSPARPASESPRRRKPREASVTYGDLSDTASASVSDTRVFLDCGKLDAGVGAALLERPPRPAAFGQLFSRLAASGGKGLALWLVSGQ